MLKFYRRIVSVIAATAVLSSASAVWAAEPQSVMEDSFAYPVGTDIKTEANGWKFDAGDSNAAVYSATAAADPSGAENTALKIDVTQKGANTGSKYSYLRYPFNPVSDSKCNEFSYRIYIPSDVEGYNTQATSVGANGDVLGAPIYLALDDTLANRTGPFYQTISIGTKESGLNRLKMRGSKDATTNDTREVDFPLEADCWHTVSTIVDSVGKRIHMTVLNEKSGTVQSEALYYQRYLNAPATLAQFEVYPHFGFQNVMVYLDDFELKAYDYTDTIAADKTALTLDDIADFANVTKDFALPEFGSVYKSVLSWESSNPSVIKVENGRALVAQAVEDTTVTLTATLQGAVTDTKEFVLTVPGAGSLGEAFQKLTLAKLTSEYSQAITTSFSLDTSSFITGVHIDWSSSDASVIAIDGTEAVVSRKDYDRPVTLTAKLSANGSDAVMYKSFKLNVWAAEPTTELKETFNYTEFAGMSISEVTPMTVNGWKQDYADGIYFNNSNTKLKPDPDDEAGCLIEHVRTVVDGSGKNNNITWSLPEVQTGKTVIMQARMNFNTETASRYSVEFFGKGTTVGGTVNNALIPVDIAFDYSSNRIWSTQVIDGNWQANNAATTISTKLPELGKWFDLKVEMRLTEQVFDIYIDGERLNTTSVPFRCSGDPTPNNAAKSVDNINLFRTYIFRSYGDGELLIDDLSMRGIEKESTMRPFQLGDVIYKDEQGQVVPEMTSGGTVDSIRVIKQHDKNAVFIVALYQDSRLLDTYTTSVSASTTVSCGLKLPDDLTGVQVKAFVWDDCDVSMMPLSDTAVLR